MATRSALARARAGPPAALGAAVRHVRTSPMFAVLDQLGDPWVLRLLHEIARGHRRFELLVERLAAPRSTLAARLRALVDAGCLRAEPYSERPLRVDYALTPKGADALGAVLLLRQWTARWARRRADRTPPPRHRCGAPLIVEVVCARCDLAVEARAMAVLDFPPPAPADAAPALPPLPRYRRTRRGDATLTPAQRLSPTGEECVGDRWISLVVGGMLLGLRRFRDFGVGLDIAPNILSARLVQLDRAGLVERRADAYRLTAKGLALYPAIAALQAWGERWLTPDWARDAGWSALHRPCASWLTPRLVCRACRAPVEPGDVAT